MSKNYIIEHTDNGYIKIVLKNKPGVNYFSENGAFLEVLDEWHVTMSYDMAGRLEADIWKGKWRNHVKVYMYDLVFGCYSGMIHADTLIDDLKKYRAWKKTQGLTMDHVDGNISNNTDRNIALMTLSNNDKKQSFPAGFVGPYTLTTAYVDGEYRVQLAFENTVLDSIQQLLDRALPGAFRLNEAGRSALHFICTDENNFVLCLKYLYDTRFSWCNPGESARAYKRLHKDITHFAADVEQSIAAQRALARMDRSQFQIFTIGEC